MDDPQFSRETIKSVMDEAAAISPLLETVPHGVAKAINQRLESIIDIVGELLPGGYFTCCEACGLPIGNDEPSATGEEDGATLCGDCLKRYELDGSKIEEPVA